jgi:hypothetical protein
MVSQIAPAVAKAVLARDAPLYGNFGEHAVWRAQPSSQQRTLPHGGKRDGLPADPQHVVLADLGHCQRARAVDVWAARVHGPRLASNVAPFKERTRQSGRPGAC